MGVRHGSPTTVRSRRSIRRPVRVVAAIAAACGVWAGPAAAAQPTLKNSTVYVQGDSLSVGMAAPLRRLLVGDRLNVSARIGRHLDEGLRILKQRVSVLPPVVVIGLGTNDDTDRTASFTSGVRAALSAVGGTRCTIWINFYQRPETGKRNPFWRLNHVLAAMAQTQPRLAIVPWAAIAARHPAWFAQDAVHPPDAGYAALARAVAVAVHSCSLSGKGSPGGGLAPPTGGPSPTGPGAGGGGTSTGGISPG